MRTDYGGRKPPPCARNIITPNRNTGTFFHCPFTEGGGPKVGDTHGRRDLSLTSGAAWTQGPLGYGVSFNGSSRLVTQNETQGVLLGTWIVWAQESGSGVRALMSHNDDGYSTNGAPVIQLFYLNSGVLTLGYRNTRNGAFTTVTGGSGLADGKLHMFACRRGFRGVNSALFVDGVKVTDTGVGQNIDPATYTNATYSVGQAWGGDGGWSFGMSGVVYSAQVLSYQIPDELIAEMYETPFFDWRQVRPVYSAPVQDTRTRRRTGVMTL